MAPPKKAEKGEPTNALRAASRARRPYHAAALGLSCHLAQSQPHACHDSPLLLAVICSLQRLGVRPPNRSFELARVTTRRSASLFRQWRHSAHRLLVSKSLRSQGPLKPATGAGWRSAPCHCVAVPCCWGVRWRSKSRPRQSVSQSVPHGADSTRRTAECLDLLGLPHATLPGSCAASCALQAPPRRS